MQKNNPKRAKKMSMQAMLTFAALNLRLCETIVLLRSLLVIGAIGEDSCGRLRKRPAESEA
jgi:hypothetical protein